MLTLTLVFSAVYMNWPQPSSPKLVQDLVPEEVAHQRRLLYQVADKIVRYQKYYREVFGRYTGDIQSLGIPNQLIGGTTEEVFRHYEVFIELRQGQRFFVRARARPILRRNSVQAKDVFRIDQDFLIHNNFPEPQMSREFLMSEADRVLRLREREKEAVVGIAQKYWIFSKEKLENSAVVWTASGVKGRVRGAERGAQRSLAAVDVRGENSIFSKITAHLRVGGANIANETGREPSSVIRKAIGLSGIQRFLELGRFAQHVYSREFGHFAITWEDLDEKVGFRLTEMGSAYSNISLEPIELSRDDYRLRIRGTAGDILGEVFSMDKFGNLEQIRFTDVIVERLRATTEFLSDPNRFQISELPDENTPVITRDRRQKENQDP